MKENYKFHLTLFFIYFMIGLTISINTIIELIEHPNLNYLAIPIASIALGMVLVIVSMFNLKYFFKYKKGIKGEENDQEYNEESDNISSKNDVEESTKK